MSQSSKLKICSFAIFLNYRMNLTILILPLVSLLTPKILDFLKIRKSRVRLLEENETHLVNWAKLIFLCSAHSLIEVFLTPSVLVCTSKLYAFN